MTEKLIEYVCERCGTANVTSDAVARWDVAHQQWIVVGHYDSSECLDCAEESNLVERQLTDPTSSVVA